MRMWRAVVRRLAAVEVRDARQKAYLQGLQTGRAERAMTCGIARADHCVHDYIYDPGQ